MGIIILNMEINLKTENNKKVLYRSILILFLGIIIGSLINYTLHINKPEGNISQEKQENIVKSRDKTLVDATSTNLAKQDDYLQRFKQCLAEKEYNNSLIIYQESYKDSTELSIKLQNYLFEYLATKPYDVKVLVLKLYLEHFADDFTFIVKLAETYKKNSEFYQALVLFLQADIRNEAWLNWSDKQIYQLSYLVYNKNNNLDELLDLFIYLVQRYPSYSFYRFALAKIYLGLGYVEEAKSELFVLTDSNTYGNKAKQLLNSILNSDEQNNLEGFTVPLSKYGNHFTVSARASGIELKLLIDTGTTFTVLTSKTLAAIQKKHGLTKIGKVNLITANGEVVANLYRIKSFFLGNYEIKDLDVAESETDIDGLDGLLGMNALSNYNFFIDQADNLLSIIPKQ